MIKVRCPVCEKAMTGGSTGDWPQFPFCSPRCKLIDLGRWLGESYRIPTEAEDSAPAHTDDDAE